MPTPAPIPAAAPLFNPDDGVEEDVVCSGTALLLVPVELW